MLDGVLQPFLKLVEVIHNPIASKDRAPFRFEPPFTLDLGDGAIRSKIIIKRFAHHSHRSITASSDNSDAAMHGGGAQVNQEAMRFQDTLRFVEGMNHALMGDSSQHPGEHHYVERFAGVVDALGGTHLKVDSLRESLGQIPARHANELGVRVARVYHGAKLREALGEPPLPATDFEDTFAMPIGDAFERAHFILFRINAEGHLSSLLECAECLAVAVPALVYRKFRAPFE